MVVIIINATYAQRNAHCVANSFVMQIIACACGTGRPRTMVGNNGPVKHHALDMVAITSIAYVQCIFFMAPRLCGRRNNKRRQSFAVFDDHGTIYLHQNRNEKRRLRRNLFYYSFIIYIYNGFLGKIRWRWHGLILSGPIL